MAERWQRREREVDAHVANGDVVVHGDGGALLEHLDQLDTSSCDEQPVNGALPVTEAERRSACDGSGNARTRLRR